MNRGVTIATFNEPEQAEPLRHRLEGTGIKAYVSDERNLQKFWLMSEQFAGIRLQVDRPDYERAEELLQEWDKSESALQDAIHCPDCGSSEVQFPQFNRKFKLAPTLFALLSAVGLFKRKFYCRHCHYTWPTKVQVAAPTDDLGWPIKSKGAADEPDHGRRPA